MSLMKKNFILMGCVGALSLPMFTSMIYGAVCSKDVAQKKVEAFCAKVEKKGDSVKAEWPDSIKFENCGENYIWIQDTSAQIKMIMHPIKTTLNGQPLIDIKDKNGVQLFKEFDTLAKKTPAGGWVDYLWAKPGTDAATPKTSFVKLCKLPSGESWIAGSGMWKEDLK